MELARFESEFYRRPDNPVISLTFTIASRIVDRSVAAADASMVQARAYARGLGLSPGFNPHPLRFYTNFIIRRVYRA